jgi:uncharacterized damage-inducible protein DinB
MCVGLVQTHRAFAYNNAWANNRLLGACADLTQGEFEAERTGFFPSLQATLNHIYVIDLFYVDALEGGWLGPKAWENPIPFPALAELSGSQASMDQRLIGVCNALTPALLSGEVRINRGTRVQVERRDRLLMHLFQHQIHHHERCLVRKMRSALGQTRKYSWPVPTSALSLKADVHAAGWNVRSVPNPDIFRLGPIRLIQHE